jgi:hypothetical protein
MAPPVRGPPLMPCWCPPPCFPSLHAQGSRHPASVHKWGTQGGARKVCPPPFGPSPHDLHRTGSAEPPPPTPLARPRSCVNRGLSFAPRWGTGAGLCSTPPPPPFSKRAQGWTATWETWHPLPSAPHLSPFACNAMGEVQRGRGHAKGSLHAPAPSCCVAPACVPPVGAPLLPFCARGSRHPSSVCKQGMQGGA